MFLVNCDSLYLSISPVLGPALCPLASKEPRKAVDFQFVEIFLVMTSDLFTGWIGALKFDTNILKYSRVSFILKIKLRKITLLKFLLSHYM